MTGETAGEAVVSERDLEDLAGLDEERMHALCVGCYPPPAGKYISAVSACGVLFNPSMWWGAPAQVADEAKCLVCLALKMGVFVCPRCGLGG